MTSQPEKYSMIREAVGEQEAERLIICEMGSVDEVFEHLVSFGTIETGDY